MGNTGHTLQAILDEGRRGNFLRQNRMLFASLEDDDARDSLYAELRKRRFPVLRFKGVERKGGNGPWPSEDVYLLTARADIELALRTGSVRPYASLDSGGRFMLGIDAPCPHARQRRPAWDALKLQPHEIERCVREALVRAMLLPQNTGEFDLVQGVALQAAVRFIALVFGLGARSHVHLEHAMQATYTRLTFQIIGRHFVPDDGLPSPNGERAKKLRHELEEFVRCAAQGNDLPEWWDRGILDDDKSVSVRLAERFGAGDEMTTIVILGLMAGTVGNITAAVAHSIDHFFRTGDRHGGRLVDWAARAAREGNTTRLENMVARALLRRPPAPFLARTATRAMRIGGRDVPAGAELLLALGADRTIGRDLLFGGSENDPRFAHSCIGRHLAWPLVYETVRQLLLLPGLAQVIDPATDRPVPLKKRWGAICETFPLRCQRDRRLNQQPLYLVLPIKEPVGENAFRLQELTRAGAPVVERALNDARNVHFAWFGLVENNTHLAMYTVYDGDFYAYVEHFALKVPLFDEQFKFLKGAPPTPVRQHPREFVEFIRAHNRAPLADFFYSAYPRLGVAEIFNAGLVRP